ncbi:MAG: XdhC family protein [Bacteroidota bacterium]
MKSLITTINAWQEANKKFAIARVIKTWNAAPRPVGSIMLISEDQEMAGSVSGGCVEGAVVKAAQKVLTTGTTQLLEFGVSNDDAWTVGLSCGGRIEVLLSPFFPTLDPVWTNIQDAILDNQGSIWVTKLGNDGQQNALLKTDGTTVGALSDELRGKALQAYRERKSQRVELKLESWFLHVLPKKSQLFLIGAAHLTADLIQLAHGFGFECIVIDPRGIFANKTQFPQAPDQLFNEYPSEVLSQFELDQDAYAVTLSHDPKIDDNALELLLDSPVAYIGALGSRKTQAKRVDRLLEKGFAQEAIDRIHGPVGVDINAKTPQEIALSVLAEIIQIKNQHF